MTQIIDDCGCSSSNSSSTSNNCNCEDFFPISISNGGTGNTRYITNGILYFNGTNITTNNNLLFDRTNFIYRDGNQALGSILSSDANGKATWSTLSSTIGSGTLNYVAKWTPSGSKLGNSQIFDNGTNIGVRTASPTSNLTVNGTISITTDNAAFTQGFFLMPSTGIDMGWLGTGSNIIRANSSTLSLESKNANGILFKTGVTPTTLMYLTFSGRVGVGTITPGVLFDVRGQSNTLNATTVVNPTGALVVTNYANWNEFKSTSTTALITNAGNTNVITLGSLSGDSATLFTGSTNLVYWDNAGSHNLNTGEITPSLIGSQGLTRVNASTGSVQWIAGMFTKMNNTTAGVTIANAVGFFAGGYSDNDTNAGTTTSYYGFYGRDQQATPGAPTGTSRWGVFINDQNAENYFRSKLSVGESNTNVNVSALVDFASTTSGFLPPRMTTTQRDAIATPAEGLIIYNLTTHVLNFYNGAAWGAV